MLGKKKILFSVLKKNSFPMIDFFLLYPLATYAFDTKVSDEVKFHTTCTKSTQIGEYPTQIKAIFPGKGNVCR